MLKYFLPALLALQFFELSFFWVVVPKAQKSCDSLKEMKLPFLESFSLSRMANKGVEF